MILYLCQEILKGQVQANEKSPKDLDFDRKGSISHGGVQQAYW